MNYIFKLYCQFFIQLTVEETPWRSEFNRLVGLMHIQIYFERLDMRRKKLNIKQNSFCDVTFLSHVGCSVTLS